MASFGGFKCPKCGQMIMASEIKGLHEPSLIMKVCDWCDAELQVSMDPATGDIKAEKKKPS